jgi:hypothetical protein
MDIATFTRYARTVCASLALALVSSPTAYGVTFDVNNTADAPDAQIDGVCATAAPPVCTLRAAIQEANAMIDADVINLPAGKYALKLVGAGEDAAATGDLDVVNDLTIAGAGAATTFVNGKKDRVFQVLPGIALTMRDLTVAKGKVGTKDDVGDDAFSGGGIRTEGDLTLERVVVKSNATVNEGGGIVSFGGSLVATDTTVEKNKALDDAGGIELIGTAATLTRVTVSKNKAADEGGGVHAVLSSAVTMENCTLSGNSARDFGGALRIESDATVDLTNVTFHGNKSKIGAGGIDRSPDGGVTTLKNVILNKNKQTNCFGALMLEGANLESGDTCGLSAAESNIKKMGLKGLKANGGSTKTHALKEESPAIDFGVDANCPATDQRGQPRVDVPGVGPRICDSGAFEFVPAP